MKQFMKSKVQVVGVLLLFVSFGASANTYYFHNDHLGTPQVLTDEDQNVVWQGRYDPFGKVEETVALVEQNLRFPGQYLDRESGLHYNYFRDYDAGTGRYVQSDPIGLGGGVSLYGYGMQNPVLYVDFSGLDVRRCYRLIGNAKRRNTNLFASLEKSVGKLWLRQASNRVI